VLGGVLVVGDFEDDEVWQFREVVERFEFGVVEGQVLEVGAGLD
jgi:hypothetical protein